MKIIWVVIFAIVFIWSAIAPNDYYIWVLEVFPAVIGAAILAATNKKFPLTTLTSVLILIHCVILMVGGHYTYAEVPLFDWLKEIFSWQRNNYDKVGHFVQGFVPAIVAREILLRNHVVNGRSWLNFLIVSICLAISAFYELIEWWVALLSGTSAEAFLGTQGYSWDTQSDMAWAIVGCIFALFVLAGLHDRQLQKI